MKLVLVSINAQYIHFSLSIYALSAYLRQELFKEQFFIQECDFTINQEIREILEALYWQNADIYAFSCYIWNIKQVLEISSLLKKIRPNVLIILGGPEVSYNANEVLKANDTVDFIVKGEGEVPFLKLIKEISFNSTKLSKEISLWQHLPNVAGRIKKNKQTLIFDNPLQEKIKEIFDYPFPYQNLDFKVLKGKIIYYEASRGCPFHCTYCISGVGDKNVRFLPLERVFKELSFLIKEKVQQIKFIDRTFNLDKHFCRQIWQFLACLPEEVTTNFHFEIVAELLDDEMLNFLSTVKKGRFQFEIGIQSVNQKTLKAIKRQTDFEKVKDVVNKLKKANNIHLHLDLIIGLPYEDDWACHNSFNQVYYLQADMLQLGFLKMLHGTYIRKNAEQHDYCFENEPPYEVLQNKALSFEKIEQWKKIEKILQAYYNKGICTYSIRFLIKECFEALPSKFFLDLSNFFYKKGWLVSKHAIKGAYEKLWQFGLERLKKDTCEHLRNLLRFDACLEGFGEEVGCLLRNKQEEDFVKEQSFFWRNEVLVQKYLPNYKFQSWRKIHKQYLLEVFSEDVLCYLENGFFEKKQIIILFAKQKEEIFEGKIFIKVNIGDLRKPLLNPMRI